MGKLFNQIFIFMSWVALAGSATSEVIYSDHIEVEIVSETANVVPGETLWLAIRLKADEHWHTYWKFGGDSGLATEATDWQLPAGASAGEIVWPAPSWIPFAGSDLINFAYDGEIFLPIPVSVPNDLAGDTFELSALISWQVCDDICIPGEGRVSLSLPVSATSEPDSQWQESFQIARQNTPIDNSNLSSFFNVLDDKVNVMIEGVSDEFSGVKEAYFFPDQRRIMKFGPLREVLIEDNRIQITQSKHRRIADDLASINGVLSIRHESGSWRHFNVEAAKVNYAWDNVIEAELISENLYAVPGQTLWLALRLEAAEHWHTYWKFGGDSGEPTRLTAWQAPEGVQVGEIVWPAPFWLPFPGSNLVNYAYEGEVVLPIAVQVPSNFTGETFELSTLAEWFVCADICIPGNARVELSLPVAQRNEIDTNWRQAFSKARADTPTAEHEIRSLIAVAGDRISLAFEAPSQMFANIQEAYFFPDQRRIIANGPVRDVTITDSMIQITHNQPRRMLEDLSEVYGVLTLVDDQGVRTSYDFVNPAADANTTTIAAFANSGNLDESGGGPGLWFYIFSALAGGAILNLMPCVFPVLSMKVMNFASLGGSSIRHQRLDGLAYTAGVIISFIVLASVLIALRAGGERIGWAFQFQSPIFLVLIVYLFFTMGLSLSGVFEFGGSLMGVGGSLASSKGYKGSFFTGVLATVVATPCTGPFMGAALGFALSQSWFVAMIVFIALGLGMALPVLIISFIPALAARMPKPGNWMVTFKELMAFPMYAAALFFLRSLYFQVGITGISLVLLACLVLAFGLWILQKGRLSSSMFWRRANSAICLTTVLVAVYVLASPTLKPAQALALNADGESIEVRNYEVFSRQRLTELRAEGKPVFLNMTAEWCITCKANEQTSLGTDRVKQSLIDNNITYMKGDWTNQDPEITLLLEEFNQPSVPLYILYPPNQGEPVKLPQILTPSRVVEIFENNT